jgi:hypothetical protein
MNAKGRAMKETHRSRLWILSSGRIDRVDIRSEREAIRSE